MLMEPSSSVYSPVPSRVCRSPAAETAPATVIVKLPSGEAAIMPFPPNQAILSDCQTDNVPVDAGRSVGLGRGADQFSLEASHVPLKFVNDPGFFESFHTCGPAIEEAAVRAVKTLRRERRMNIAEIMVKLRNI